MINTVDKNGDGKISFSEFRSEPDFDRDKPMNLDLRLLKWVGELGMTSGYQLDYSLSLS